MARRLKCGNPSNTQWQRDLSVSHERLGNVAVAQGVTKKVKSLKNREIECPLI